MKFNYQIFITIDISSAALGVVVRSDSKDLDLSVGCLNRPDLAYNY